MSEVQNISDHIETIHAENDRLRAEKAALEAKLAKAMEVVKAAEPVASEFHQQHPLIKPLRDALKLFKGESR